MRNKCSRNEVKKQPEKITQIFINQNNQICSSDFYVSIVFTPPTSQPTNNNKKYTNFFFNLCVIRDDVKFHWAAQTERETETKVKTTLQHKNVICLPLFLQKKKKEEKNYYRKKKEKKR